MADHGPFETEDEARAVPAVRAIYEAYRAGRGLLDCAPLVRSGCEAAGVALGAYDERIVAWLGNWEPATCAVIAGLIRRAHEAGKAAGPDGAVTEWGACRRGEAVPFVSEADEAAVRRFAADLPNTVTGLARRQITPWEVAPYGQAPE